jgi:hypothetical protein
VSGTEDELHAAAVTVLESRPAGVAIGQLLKQVDLFARKSGHVEAAEVATKMALVLASSRDIGEAAVRPVTGAAAAVAACAESKL